MIELCAAVDLKILVLENVATVSEKQIYRDRLEHILHSFGFVLAYSWVTQLGHVSPILRRRFLGVAVKAGMPLPNDPTVWPGPKRISLSKCDAWFHDLPDELLVQTMLSDHLLRMYDNPSFFPGKNGMCNPLQGRSVGQDDVLPSTVAMASYSRQHLKSVAQLSSKGLLGSLRLRNNKWAFFTGLELLISMGWSGCISLPRSNELSCHVVGNCIAEGHALQPLFAAVVLCLGTCGLHVRFPFHHVIKFWESQRARATDCSITFSEDRIVVHRPLAVTRPVFNGLHSIWVFVLIAADCIRVACPVSTKLDDLKALVSQVSSVHICGFEDERGALPEVWIAARTCTIKAILQCVDEPCICDYKYALEACDRPATHDAHSIPAKASHHAGGDPDPQDGVFWFSVFVRTPDNARHCVQIHGGMKIDTLLQIVPFDLMPGDEPVFFMVAERFVATTPSGSLGLLPMICSRFASNVLLEE